MANKEIYNDMAILELVVSLSVVVSSFAFDNYFLTIVIFLGGIIYLGVGHVGILAFSKSYSYRVWYIAVILTFFPLKFIQMFKESLFLEYKDFGSWGFLVLSIIIFIIWWLDLRKKMVARE